MCDYKIKFCAYQCHKVYLIQVLRDQNLTSAVNRLYLYSLVWKSLHFSYTASQFIKRKLPQTRLYRIICSKIENIPEIVYHVCQQKVKGKKYLG